MAISSFCYMCVCAYHGCIFVSISWFFSHAGRRAVSEESENKKRRDIITRICEEKKKHIHVFIIIFLLFIDLLCFLRLMTKFDFIGVKETREAGV